MHRRARTTLWTLAVSGLVSLTSSAAYAQVTSVSAVVETDPVADSGDAADDPAIWVHPTDVTKSVVLGTNKLGGIGVYRLNGEEMQYLPDGDLNNADVRYGFDLDGVPTDIAVIGNRTGDLVAIYAIAPEDGQLRSIAGDNVDAGLTVYGTCAYQSRLDGSVYVFMNDKSGRVIQHRLVVRDSKVDLEEVRQLKVPTQVEGCVADDENAAFYLGEEDVGIWKFGAEPGDGEDGELIATVGDKLRDDVEGLAVFQTSDGDGYLLASSQGNNTYVAFDRAPPHAWIATFEIVDGGGIDGTTDTDGIEVMSTGLGPDFPAGIFVAQDGTNPGDNQNFKFVSWKDVADDAGLLVDPEFDPRARPDEPTPGEDTGMTDAGTNPGGDAGTISERDAGTTGAPDAGTTTPDAGGSPGADGGTSTGAETQGCGCAQTGATPTAPLLVLFGLLVGGLRRRARR